MDEVLKEALKEPTLRCLECGCKYNFQRAAVCPKCNSDKSNSLENENPFTDPAWRIAIAIIFIILLMLKPLIMKWVFS